MKIESREVGDETSYGLAISYDVLQLFGSSIMMFMHVKAMKIAGYLGYSSSDTGQFAEILDRLWSLDVANSTTVQVVNVSEELRSRGREIIYDAQYSLSQEQRFLLMRKFSLGLGSAETKNLIQRQTAFDADRSREVPAAVLAAVRMTGEWLVQANHIQGIPS